MSKSQGIFKDIFKKIIHHHLFVLCIVRLIQFYTEFIFLTSRIEICINHKSANILRSNAVCFLTLWHGKMILFPKVMSCFGKFQVLTSLHKDGEYVDKFIQLYGHKSIRGSSDKNGLSAIREIIKSIENNNRIIITPDGPRGPRYKVNSAVTNLASRFKIPILIIAFVASRFKVLNSWDAFEIPLPFTKIIIDISSPHFFYKKHNSQLEYLMRKQIEDLSNKV